jgi:hypothetical protein
VLVGLSSRQTPTPNHGRVAILSVQDLAGSDDELTTPLKTMTRLTYLGRAAGLLTVAWVAACGSITPNESGDDGGGSVGGGAAGSGSAGGAAGSGSAGGGGTAGMGGAPSTDAAVQKDSSPVDSTTLNSTDCMPGERRCDGNTPLSCDATGSWQRGAPCSNVCSAGGCVGVCTPGAKMCVGNIPQYCDGQGLWQAAPACAYVCRQGDCTGVCLPGARQCSATGAPQSCTVDGAWDTGPTCPFVCSQGGCTGVCRPGDRGCSGNATQSCSSAGDWQPGTTCPYVCTNGGCAGSCNPGTRQCAGNVPETCSSSGVWQDGQACPFVCAGGGCSGSCVPGATQCTNGQKQICDGSGSWQNTASPPMQLLANAGFDSGHTAWTESSLSTSLIITPDSALTEIMAQSPSYLAWLGGYANALDDLSQVVTVPAGATSIALSFYYSIFTAEMTAGVHDTMDVYTYDSATATYTPLATFNDDMPSAAWIRFSIQLPVSLAGRTFTLGFKATTDGNTKITNFFVDTVSLDVTVCTP